MGISIDRYSHPYINKLTQPAQENKLPQKVRAERKFDEVLISANSRQTEEKKITEGLAKEVMTQVHQPVSESKIESLRESVARGEYRVDADAVARRMLLMEGEKSDE